jgi:hypothetical protein
VPEATEQSPQLRSVRTGAAVLCLAGFASLIVWTLTDVSWIFQEPVPNAYPGRGFFFQALGRLLLPLAAGAALGAASLVTRTAYRIPAALGAVASVILLRWALAPGGISLVPAVLLAPALLYVLLSRRPEWWLTLVLAAAPLVWSLSVEVLY